MIYNTHVSIITYTWRILRIKKNALLIILLVLTMLLSACGNSSDKAKTITASDLNSALSSYEVELEVVESDKKVTQFTITASGVNADQLLDAAYVKEAYNLIMNDPVKSTYGHYKALCGFGPVMSVLAIIDTTADGDFDEDAFFNEVIDVICNGKAHTEAGWTITAKVDTANDTITITGISE